MDNIGTTTSHPTKVTGLKPLNTVNSKTNHINSSPTTTHTSTNNTSLSEGNYIEHERFGIGQVIKIEGSSENTKATVKFENTGTKQLLLRFARFKVIG
jgi:DNA helicase-2/ATP-dependent DNA helicase PcrA